MADEPEPTGEYVILRAAAGMPAGYMPDELDGRWYDKATVTMIDVRCIPPDVINVAFYATGRIEVRDDGVTGEVYELRP